MYRAIVSPEEWTEELDIPGGHRIRISKGGLDEWDTYEYSANGEIGEDRDYTVGYNDIETPTILMLKYKNGPKMFFITL